MPLSDNKVNEQNKNEIAVELHPEFTARLREVLSEDELQEFMLALSRPPVRMARLNPVKPVPIEKIRAEILSSSLLLSTDAKPKIAPLHHAGAYYVQDPSATLPANELIPLLPEGARVLDMCAAPGGKVTAVAAARPDCTFVANEIDFSRAKILLSNIERLGLRNCTVTSLRPDEIASKCAGLFDAVIADVPCSGEGMIRKVALTNAEQSDVSVAACITRAEKILFECDRALKRGGLLAFSTCTLNRGENEDQVRKLLGRGYETVPPAFRPPHAKSGVDLPDATRIIPCEHGEGHFFCLLRKCGEYVTRLNSVSGKKIKESSSDRVKKLEAKKLLEQITREDFPIDRITIVGEGCELLPPDYPYFMLPALRRGVRLCDYVSSRAVPHHHFATAANPDLLIDSPDYDPICEIVRSYLAGEEIGCEVSNGYRVLRTQGITLGLIKVSGGRAKNHYPKGLRVK